MSEVTGVGTHVATQAGYAEGRIIAEGEDVPAGVPIPAPDEHGNLSGNWMEAKAAAAEPEPEEAPADPAS